MRLLLIGSLPPPVGGVTVTFKHLVDQLSLDRRTATHVINISNVRTSSGISWLRAIRTVWAGFLASWRTDVVSLHCASTALPTLGLAVFLTARITRKPLVIRKFAGFDYMDLGPVRRRLAHFVVSHCSLYLAETKRLVRLAENRDIGSVAWYPTSRPMPPDAAGAVTRHSSCRRFVYVGHVRECKGIRAMIEAAERLEDGISVDVYGPLFEGLNERTFAHCRRIRYRGVLTPDAVPAMLRRYDALLLPTRATTEGYPGCILEAYSVGLPVIATTCGAIPEIVDETTGILVPPGDVEGLFAAMRRLVDDPALYARLQAGTREKGSGFSCEFWSDHFVRLCQRVSGAAVTRSVPVVGCDSLHGHVGDL